MKHNLNYLIISYTIFAGPLCHAMENTGPQKDLITEITILKKPRFVEFITGNKAVIAGDGCSIINPATNTEIKRISDFPCTSLAIHQNKQKIALVESSKKVKRYDAAFHKKVAVDSSEEVAIYNAESYEREWSIQEEYGITEIHFNKYKPTILVTSGMLCCTAIYDYKKHMCQQKEVYYPKDFHNDSSLNSLYLPLKNVDALKKSCQSLIIPNSVFKRSLQWTDAKYCWNKSILAVLCQLPENKRIRGEEDDFCFIRFWDTRTETLIYETPELKSKNCYQLAISPDENQLLIACESKCILLDIPLEVIKKNVIFMYLVLKNYKYWALKNYKLNYNESLPLDIVSLIIKMICLPYIKLKAS